MPKGFTIFRWSMTEGLILMKKYPPELKVETQDMMRVLYTHITGAEEQKNVVVRLDSAQSSISSHFTGQESKVPYMINVFLELGEDPEMFGHFINRIHEDVLKMLNKLDDDVSHTVEIDRDLDKYFKRSFDYLERLTNLSKEQRVAQIFSSPKGQEILTILQEGPISKKEFKAHLEKNLKHVISNLELTIDPFTETEIIKEDWIEGHRDQYLFLLNDFTIIRGPATRIIEEAKNGEPTPGVAKEYLKQVSNFFSNYQPTLEDSLMISSNLMHPDMYDIIKLFAVETHNYHKIPPSFGTPEIKKLINQLIEQKILTKIVDKKDEWIMLLSDIDVNIFFPEYLLETIRKNFKNGKLKKEVAIKHLSLLEKSYKRPE